MRFFCIIVLTTFCFSCLTKQGRVKCFEKKYHLELNEPKVSVIKNMVIDSLNSWANLRMKYMTSYNSKNMIWKVDKIVFNKSGNRLLGWVLKKYTNKESNVDYIKMFVGEKRNGNWIFYFRYMPNIMINRNLSFKYLKPKHTKGMPYSFDDLSEIAVYQMVQGGLFKFGSCKIDHSYIDSWFDLRPGNLEEGYIKSRTEILKN